LNILYYIPYLNQDLGGTRQYASTLLKILSDDMQNEYFILHNNNDPEIYWDLSKLNYSVFNNIDVKFLFSVKSIESFF
jgi:hypothetical protein